MVTISQRFVYQRLPKRLFSDLCQVVIYTYNGNSFKKPSTVITCELTTDASQSVWRWSAMEFQLAVCGPRRSRLCILIGYSFSVWKVLHITVCWKRVICQEVQISEQIFSLETIIVGFSISVCPWYRFVCFTSIIFRRRRLFHGLQIQVPGLLTPF